MRSKYFKVVGKFAAVVLLAAALGWSTASCAQVIPGPADASRIPAEIQNGTWPPAAPALAAPGAIETPPPPAMLVPAGAEKIIFTLRAVDLSGVTVYKPGTLKALWEKDLGKSISLLRLYEIAESITVKYRADGYMLSRAFVPGQTIAGGVVKLSVVEGYIRDVRFEGEMPSSYLLEQARGTLLGDRPLRTKILERQMLLLNDLPGTDFRAILKPLPANVAARDLQDARTGDVWIIPHAPEHQLRGMLVFQSGNMSVYNKSAALPLKTAAGRTDPKTNTKTGQKTDDKKTAAAPHQSVENLKPQIHTGAQCNTAVSVTAYMTSAFPGKKSGSADPGQVIYIAADDDSADGVARQLKLAGANLDSCHIVESIRGGGPLSLVKHGSKLEHDLNAVREMIRDNKDTQLIVLDPVEAYFGDLKSKKADVRAVLAPLAQIAARNNVPILAVSRAAKPKPAPVVFPALSPAVLPAEPNRDGGVLLVIEGKPRSPVQALLSLDNAESRFLGPWLAGVKLSLMRGLLPYEQTDVSFNFTPGSQELRYANITHTIPLTADGLKLALQGGYTKGLPGFTLTPDKIVSITQTAGASLSWDAVRQRTQNLRVSVGIDALNSRTDSLGSPLFEDRTRAVKLQGHYDEQDRFQGTTTLDVTLSKGLNALGASNVSDATLSRANGRPDFLTLATQDYRFQKLTDTWNAVLGFSGQLSDSALLSEQQFGYGGQAFGRAYDPSQIVGDSGFAGTLELRYDGMKMLADAHLQPFTFYDMGVVWNRDPGQPARQTGSSAGAGVRLSLPKGTNASLLLAEPLTLRETDPQYGDGKAPRVVFSLSQAL